MVPWTKAPYIHKIKIPITTIRDANERDVTSVNGGWMCEYWKLGVRVLHGILICGYEASLHGVNQGNECDYK